MSSVSFASHDIVFSDADGASAVFTADLDGDGDTDVLSASAYDGKIAWYENIDSPVGFGQQQVITTEAEYAQSVHAADLDGDGDLDVLCGFDGKIEWYENFRPGPGDANRDLQFDQLDIVQVLQSAKYLTGELATWDQGDWNEDGKFDQEDIVLALQEGNYLQGPYAAVDTVFAGT